MLTDADLGDTIAIASGCKGITLRAKHAQKDAEVLELADRQD